MDLPDQCPKCRRLAATLHADAVVRCVRCGRYYFASVLQSFKVYENAHYRHIGCSERNCATGALCRDFEVRPPEDAEHARRCCQHPIGECRPRRY